MSVVELSDEENVAILAETFTDSLADLRDKTRQLAVLKRLSALLNSSAPQHYIYSFSTPTPTSTGRSSWPRSTKPPNNDSEK